MVDKKYEAPNSKHLPSSRKGGTSRRQAKSQINPNHPNSKQILFDHLKLGFGHYWGFEIWKLEFFM